MPPLPRDPSSTSSFVSSTSSSPSDDHIHHVDVAAVNNNNNSNKSTLTAVYQGNDPRPPLDNFMLELNVYSAIVLLGLWWVYTAVAGTPITTTTSSSSWLWKILGSIIALDCAHYYHCKGRMEAVPYTLPFVALTSMILYPNRFWSELAGRAMRSPQGMCGTTLCPFTFLVFCTDPSKCREILTGEGTFGVYAHPNAAWLFGRKNLIYLDTIPHKQFRGILTPALFSHEALQLFAKAQERVVRNYMANYCHNVKTIDAQVHFRSMAAASSQESFLGPYITDDTMRNHLEKDILTFTMGFLCFPIPFIGGLKTALQAKDRIEHTIVQMIPQSRAYMMQQPTPEPRCMLDYWSLALIEAARQKNCQPQDVLDCCQDEDMARTVLDFLFAAQDATNSALTAAMDVLDAHRDVLQRMRDEVDAHTNNPTNKRSIADVKDQLGFVSKVANQLLHHRPPVPMIPHITKKACLFAGEYPLKKGVVVIPSITYSARASGESLEFLPDRPDSETDNLFVKCVTFGGGQHKCPGRRYAESLLVVFLAILAQEYDWHRTGPRPNEDEFIYFPTIFPKDTLFVLEQRSDDKTTTTAQQQQPTTTTATEASNNKNNNKNATSTTTSSSKE